MSKELEALDTLYYSCNVKKLEQAYKFLKEYLKSIDNANPSEALKCSLKLYKMVESAGNGNGFSLNEAWEYYKTIKQALLKAQQPKHYLKWEDLEFTNEVKEMKVKLGDNTYEIEYYICNALGLHQPVVILKTSDFIAITIEQFFNDLRLERVEE